MTCSIPKRGEKKNIKISSAMLGCIMQFEQEDRPPHNKNKKQMYGAAGKGKQLRGE